jgi:hypothetical protein
MTAGRARRWGASLAGGLLAGWLLAQGAQAQVAPDPAPPGTETYANTRWSLKRVDQDPTDACVGGFFTFQFSPTGYFVYNNHIRGSWRVDGLGNIRLKTSKGQLLMLLASGSTLRAPGNVGFLLKKNVFERCP